MTASVFVPSKIRKQLQQERVRLLLRAASGAGSDRRTRRHHAARPYATHASARQLLSSEQARLAKIETALKRLDQGTYGLCRICGKPITIQRLERMPYATQCVACRQIQ